MKIINYQNEPCLVLEKFVHFYSGKDVYIVLKQNKMTILYFTYNSFQEWFQATVKYTHTLSGERGYINLSVGFRIYCLLNHKKHREDGPAYENANDIIKKHYYINGKHYKLKRNYDKYLKKFLDDYKNKK